VLANANFGSVSRFGTTSSSRANGDFYFTDQGQTGLQDPAGGCSVLRADGTLNCIMRNVPSPNGLVLSHDENTLFLNVTRANAVWRLPLLPSGEVDKRQASSCSCPGRFGADRTDLRSTKRKLSR
jgi:gluconolactonase